MKYYTVNGMTGTIGQLAKANGISKNTVRDRLNKGYSIERALSKERIQPKLRKLGGSEQGQTERGNEQRKTPEYDLKACRRLGMKAVLQAYMDFANMLAADMVFSRDDESLTKALRNRKRVLYNKAKNKQSEIYRCLVRSQSKKTFTRTVPQKPPIEDCLQEVLNEIRRNGLNSRAFLESDRLFIFTDLPGEYLLDTAKRQVALWAVGKIPTYSCRFSTIGCEAESEVDE